MIVLISILSVALIAVSIACYVLVRRSLDLVESVQDLEELLEIHQLNIVDVKTNLIKAFTIIKEIDKRGVFESDDEVGRAFKLISEEIQKLDDYISQISYE